jgi:hypothetical protein
MEKVYVTLSRSYHANHGLMVGGFIDSVKKGRQS